MKNTITIGYLALISALLLAFGPRASATVLSYDAFSAYTAANLSGQAYKGTGYASGGSWSGGTCTVSSSGGLAYTSGQTLPVAGGKVSYSNSGDCTANLDITAGGTFGLAGLTSSSKIGGAAGTLYYSFLYQKNATISNQWGGLELYNGGTEILGIPTRSANPNTFSWFGRSNGDLKNNLGTGSTFTQDGNVHLFVVKIVFNGSGSDQVTIWMDPNLNNAENSQNSSTTYYATTSGDFRFDNFHIRGSYAYYCDEPRFATTFSEAVGGLLPLTATWNNASGGSWATAANWTPTTVLNLATTTGDFSSLNLSGNTTVTLDGSYNSGPLTFADTTGADGNWIIAPGSGGTLTIAGPVTVTNQTATISAVLAGSGGLTKSGAGTLVIAGTNTYTGGTTLSAGTLRLGTGGSLANANPLTIGGGNFDPNGQNQAVANLNATGGTLTNSAATDSTLTISTAASTVGNCTATLTTPGTGKLNLVINSSPSSGTANSAMALNNTANTFSGSITVNGNGFNDGNDWHGGLLGINGDASLGNAANSITLNNGGGLCNLWSPTSSGWPSHGGFTLGAGRTITLAGTLGGVIRLGYGDSATINSTITGTGKLARTDGGNLTLNAANTFTGDTLIVGGTLTLGNALALQYSTLDRDYTGGTLSFGSLATATLGGLKGVANLTIPSGGTLTLGNSANNCYFGVLIGGNTGSALIKTGAGTQQLAGANTYAGTTTVNNGTLLVSSGGSIANGPVAVNGGTLKVIGGSVGTGGVAVSSGTLSVQNFTDPSSTPAYRYIRFQVSAVQGGGTNNLQMSELAFYSAGSNNINGARVYPLGVSGGGTWSASANEGPNSLSDNNTGTKWNYNSSTYPEAVTFDFGTAQTFTGYDWATANDTTPARNPNNWQVYGSTDGGTWTLLDTRTNAGATPTATLTWAGGWTFPALANASSSVNGAVIVNSGGTLNGNGTVAGAVTVNSNGTLAPGLTAGIGTLSISNALTLNSGSASNFRLSKTGGTPANDKVTGLTGATYDGTLTVTDVTSDATSLAYGDKFTLFTLATGTYGGSFASLNLPTPPPGLKWDSSGLTVDGSVMLIYAGQTSAPTFDPPGGGYVGAQTVTMTCADAGSTVYYTINGSTPTSGSSHGTPGSGVATVIVPVNTGSMTVQSIAIKAGFVDSAVVGATYGTVTSPVWINAAGGNWSAVANWSNNVVANGIGVTADFSNLSLAADTTVTLDSAKTAGTLLFNDASGYNWILADGSGALTLAVASGSPTIAVNHALITATINPVIAGTSGLDKTGAGTLALGGANIFTGNTKISGGTVVLANPLALQNSTLDYSGYGGMLDLSVVSTATLGGLKGNQDLLNYATLTVGNNNESTEYAGQLYGSGGLTKVGAGTLILSGTNSYSGTTKVNAGTLQLATGGQIGSAALTVSGGKLDLNGQSQSVGKLTGTGGTLDNSSSIDTTLTVSTTASSAGNCATTLTNSGVGKLNLVFQSSLSPGNNISGMTLDNTANSFAGSITVVGNGFNDGSDWHGGLLGINGDASLGNATNPITLTNGGVLCNLLSPNSGGSGWPRHAAFTLGAARTITLAGTLGGVIRTGYAETCTINSTITGAGMLSKDDSGALVLGGGFSNTYGGATTLGSTGKILLAKTGGAIAIPGNINISSTAWNGNASGIVLGGNEQIADTSVITWTTTTLGGGAEYAGFLRLNGHTETIGGLVAQGSGANHDPEVENRGYGDTATTYGTALLILNVTGSNSYTYNGHIRDFDGGTGGGAVAITKAGSGSQILSGSMNYTGATTVNGGTLEVDGSMTSPITVASGGTLQGTGSTTSSLTIHSGGILAPGNGAGTFASGNTTLAGTYACEVDGATADRLTVTGNLDISGATLEVTLLNPPTNPSYVIASYTGALTGTFATTQLPAGHSLNYDTPGEIHLVGAVGSYGAWETLNGITGAGPNADSNNNGIPNGIEFVIGGNPSGTASDSNRLLPTIAVDGSDLIFTYRRTAESVAYGPAVEYGSNLTGWTTAEDSLNGVMISVASDEFGPGIDGVEVKIPLSLAAGGPLYARLKVTIP